MKNHTASMVLLTAMVLLSDITAAQVDTLHAADYARSIAAWQEEREANLKGPNGWLNIAGLHWLRPGATTIGSATHNDIVLAGEKAPPELGTFLLEGEGLSFRAELGVEVLGDGVPIRELSLVHDGAGEPTHLAYGALGWHIIQRMERLGVRLRDYEHPAISAFAGLRFHPVDPAWRVVARFNAYVKPRRPVLTTVVEGLGWNPSAPGILEFELGGEALSLQAYELEDSFFLIFSDLTSGETTYPAGRYLYADKPGPDGITVLDFNKAQSPPCAYTNFATCPLPTKQNRMALAIEAGEQY